MKNVKIVLILLLIAVAWWFQQHASNPSQKVNALLGDQSFEETFGYRPHASTNEQLRIATHLAYVEKVLRDKEVAHLTEDLQAKRIQLLDYLHTYWNAGVFPKNYDFPDERKPCFIDKDGSICAVGYLIEQTVGRQVAEYINDRYKYDELLAMNDEKIDQWIASSGLTKEECAMIQPAYNFPDEGKSSEISVGYGISSSVLGGLNIAFSTINGIHLAKGVDTKTIPVLGLVSGAGQTALGVANISGEKNVFGVVTTNQSHKNLSMVNIGLGTTTMLLSAWSLITNHTPKPRRTTWNIHTFPTQHKGTGMALSLQRKF